MPSINSWNIRPRSNRCCVTDREFDNDEIFYTAIFFNNETNSYERSDFSVQAWEEKPQSNDEKNLFSFWRSKFEKEEPAIEKEVVEKESAEVNGVYRQQDFCHFGPGKRCLSGGQTQPHLG